MFAGGAAPPVIMNGESAVAPTLRREEPPRGIRWRDALECTAAIGAARKMRAVGGLLPDRTFVLALDSDTAAARATAKPDRIEREGVDFMTQVSAAYRELGERFPERIVVLDGTDSPEALAEEVRGRLELS